ncbi:hypothetical protein Btru_031056 [Bulinus truncatus]|nr:hypothetical protein Btru_031056 [Bulinus truncatus]
MSTMLEFQDYKNECSSVPKMKINYCSLVATLNLLKLVESIRSTAWKQQLAILFVSATSPIDLLLMKNQAESVDFVKCYKVMPAHYGGPSQEAVDNIVLVILTFRKFISSEFQ